MSVRWGRSVVLFSALLAGCSGEKPMDMTSKENQELYQANVKAQMKEAMERGSGATAGYPGSEGGAAAPAEPAKKE